MFRLRPNTVCHRGDPLQALSARTLRELNIVLWIKYGSGGCICTGPAPSTKQPITSGLHPATAQLAVEVICESTVWGAVLVSRLAAEIRASGAALSAGQLPSGTSKHILQDGESLQPDDRSQGDALT